MDLCCVGIFLSKELFKILMFLNKKIVEVCPTGTFFAFPAQMSHFKLNIYDSQNGVVIKVSDVLKGIICVFLLFFILYFVVNNKIKI